MHISKATVVKAASVGQVSMSDSNCIETDGVQRCEVEESNVLPQMEESIAKTDHITNSGGDGTKSEGFADTTDAKRKRFDDLEQINLCTSPGKCGNESGRYRC
jgi:hypothetical protein